MKEAVTKVIDTLTQEDLHGAFQKLLERCAKQKSRCSAFFIQFYNDIYPGICSY